MAVCGLSVPREMQMQRFPRDWSHAKGWVAGGSLPPGIQALWAALPVTNAKLYYSQLQVCLLLLPVSEQTNKQTKTPPPKKKKDSFFV